MYDNEDDIKKKRRTLIIVIGIVVLLIIILLIWLFTRNSGSSKDKYATGKDFGCILEVVSGNLNAQGTAYTSEVVVGFKEKNTTSTKITIVEYGIGASNIVNYNGNDTYTITRDGITKVIGYIRNSDGHETSCDLSVTLEVANPTCELEILKGTLGDEEWYKSDVIVGFKSKLPSKETATITKYGLALTEEEIPTENKEDYTVNTDGNKTIYGYVQDSDGKVGKCNISFKRDATPPTCKLKITEGTNNGTANITLEIDEMKDELNEIISSGIGIEKNYTATSYKVTKVGTTKVYGYVKDTAGNERTCVLSVTKKSTGGGGGSAGGNSKPKCSLKVTGGTKLSDGTYAGNVTVGFASKSSTNGASVTAYGLGTSESLNGKDSLKVTTNGTVKVYGKVQDSNNNTGVCGITVKVNTSAAKLATKVAKGDLVNYSSAKTWGATVAIPTSKNPFTFGGYTQSNKTDSSVTCYGSYKNTNNGWRVLFVENGIVTLIHAGTPECYFHPKIDGQTNLAYNSEMALKGSTSGTANSKYNVAAHNWASVYVNTKYATSATAFTKQHLDKWNGSTTNINTAISDPTIKTGAFYYLASAKDKDTLYGVDYNGVIRAYSYRAMGVRPIVVLKAGVYTTGKTNGAWNIAV